LIPVVLNPKFSMGGSWRLPSPLSTICWGKRPAKLKIIAAQLSTIGAQLIKPILDPQLELGGEGQEDGPHI